jgi:hypothetical protein
MMNTSPSTYHPLSQKLLPWFCLLLLACSLFCALGWERSRAELSAVRTELQLEHLSLLDAQQQVQAQQLINKRQSEMIREFQK